MKNQWVLAVGAGLFLLISAHLVSAVAEEELGLIPADTPPPQPAWSDEVDFLDLRIAYGRRKDFGTRCESGPKLRDIQQAYTDENHAQVLALTEKCLAQCPVHIASHLFRAISSREVGQNEQGQTHARWFEGLIQSILNSGDGKTAETAYETISVEEEYETLNYLGLRPIGQALMGQIDVFTVEDEEGNESTVYFNPSWHFIRMFDMFNISGRSEAAGGEE